MKGLKIIDIETSWRELQDRMNRVFTHDTGNNTLTINIAYPYEVDLDRIPDKAALLGWVLHFCGKSWMTTEYLEEFAERVMKIKGWDRRNL